MPGDVGRRAEQVPAQRVLGDLHGITLQVRKDGLKQIVVLADALPTGQRGARRSRLYRGGAVVQGAQERLLSYEREHGHTFWVIERKSDGAILGFCGLKRSNQQGGPIGMMEVGWRLREDAWGRGYAKEAAIASLEIAFDRFAVDEVIALTVARNEGSWGLMERLGMRRREELDFENADFDAANPVIIVYSIDRDDWRSHDA